MANDDAPEEKWLQKFAGDVLYSSVVSVTSKVLLGALLLLLGALVALIATGWEVPAWTLVAMALIAVALMYVRRRIAGRGTTKLRSRVDKAEDELDRHESYGSNICSVLDTFQKIVAKDITMSTAAFIELGILNPGRDVMQENGCPSDLRMSILIPSDDNFQMIWASGHSVEAKQKYKVPIDQTISKVAYEKQAIQVWKNAPEEERGFVKNPKATRGFQSMVSIPILRGGQTAGVFNTVTDQRSAFDPADVNYLTSLGSIIQLAFGVAIKEMRDERAVSQAEPASRGRRPIVASPARDVLPAARSHGDVVSSEGSDRNETSDE